MKIPLFNKIFAVFSLMLLCSVHTARADWGIDFTRRSRGTREADLQSSNHSATGSSTDRRPASVPQIDGEGAKADSSSSGVLSGAFNGVKSVVGSLFDSSAEPYQEIVILNTEHGFVPSSVRVRKDGRYKIHIVNVNEKEKNVSFILDGFSEHHATFYGKIKTFNLEPKKEGVFSFQSPETAAEGKLVVFNPSGVAARTPSSEDAK